MPIDLNSFVKSGRLVAIAVGAVAIASYVVIRKSTRETRKVVVTQLWVYPVKSCSGYSVLAAEVGPSGLTYDREWCVFRSDTKAFCSQRDFPRLKLLTATIEAQESSDEVFLVVRERSSFDGRAPLRVKISAEYASRVQVPISIWGLDGTVTSEGDEASAWFSEYLGVAVFLGRISSKRTPASMDKYSSRIPTGSEHIALHDFSPVHLCTEEGIAHLQAQVADKTIDVQRFRPNVVVAGAPFPSEDQWEEFAIGDAPFKTVKLTSRCSMPTIDNNGVRSKDYNPTAYLAAHHGFAANPSDSPKPMFGLCVFPKFEARQGTEAVLRVGDELQVTKHFSPPLQRRE